MGERRGARVGDYGSFAPKGRDGKRAPGTRLQMSSMLRSTGYKTERLVDPCAINEALCGFLNEVQPGTPMSIVGPNLPGAGGVDS
jgi:hypothetical protein